MRTTAMMNAVDITFLLSLWTSSSVGGFSTVAPRRTHAGAAAAATTSTRLNEVIQESGMAKYSGGGLLLADMNLYNLDDLEVIAQEWSAEVTPATPMQEAGVYLEARTKDIYLADTVKVTLQRQPTAGLGLGIVELSGGRDDGLGIVIIDSVTGVAENCGLVPGDSIIQVSVETSSKNGNAIGEDETSDVTAFATECLGYDKTVEAIQSLPAVADGEKFVVTVKRLRRKPKVQVNLQYPPDSGEDNISIELFAGENLRRALLVRGVKLNDPLAARFDSGGTGDCGAEGTCATCAVAISSGMNLLSPLQQQEAQIFSNEPQYRMSCRTVVGYGMQEGTVNVQLSPRQWV